MVKCGIIGACLTLITLTMGAFLRNTKTDGGKTDGDGHVLVSLWEDYRKAEGQDRPQKQLEILKQIKAKASGQRLAWDFYDAARQYVYVARSRNWKLRDSLDTAFENEVRAFDEPVVTFVWMLTRNKASEEILNYTNSNARKLKAGHNTVFYDAISASWPDFVRNLYANDYEYALWTLQGRRGSADVLAELKAYEAGSYPLGAYLEYVEAKAVDSEAERVKALEAYAEKYKGKAVSLFAEADLLQRRFNELSRRDDVTAKAELEKKYKALDEDCQAFEKTREGFSGDERKIVESLTSVKALGNQLNGRAIDFIDVSEDSIRVAVRNLASVQVTMNLEDSKENLLDVTLKNTDRHFYVRDTLKVAIPSVGDGKYHVVAKNVSVESSQYWSRYRISIARRTEARGICVYAADYKSGEPVTKANLVLRKNGKVAAECKDFVFDGFTPLPDEIAKALKKEARYELSCNYMDADGLLCRSDGMYLWGYEGNDASVSEGKVDKYRECRIFTDRGAYNPGDTVLFKAVILYTDGISEAKVSDQGAKYKVSLIDAEGNDVASKSLLTNEFGSIAGSFVLPTGGRNGYYTLSVDSDPKYSYGSFSRRIRVDEFVLPTFTLDFDPQEKVWFNGDSVSVKGRIASYSGHPVSSAKATYEVQYSGRKYAEGKLDVAPDGRFEIRFRSASEGVWYGSYYVTVKIADATGEIREFTSWLRTFDSIDLNVSLENDAEGTVSTIEPEEYAKILSSETAAVRMSVDRVEIPVKVDYLLKDESGKVKWKGTASSNVVEKIDFSQWPSGLYVLEARASMTDDSGKEHSDTTTLKILLVRPSDKCLDAPVQDLVMPMSQNVGQGDKAEIILGNADEAPVWALVDVFGNNAKLLETKLVHLDGLRGKEGSLEKVSFDYKAEYPDEIRLQVFYFRNSDSVDESFEYHRTRSASDFPLSFSSFEDRTLPSSTYTFGIRTAANAECLAAVFDKSVDNIQPNPWSTFSLSEVHVAPVYVNEECGGYRSDFRRAYLYGARSTKMYAESNDICFDSIEADEGMALDEVVVVNSKSSIASGAAPMAMESAEEESVTAVIRENFANTLTFQPFLRSDKDGNVSFTFTTSDKLSTYYVAVYAHDRQMNNATLRKEMTVSIPVKVNVVEPEYLYNTDKYALSASVSSNAEEAISGMLSLYVYGAGDYSEIRKSGIHPLMSLSRKIEVPAGGVTSGAFDIDVASIATGGVDTLGLMVVFQSDGKKGAGEFSDGMFVNVPVLPAEQTITESHSAVLLDGMDKAATIESLRKQFVNVSGDNAEVKEISIIDMVRDAIPSRVSPDGKDVLSLSEAWYVRELSRSLAAMSRRPMPDSASETPSDEELVRKLFACHNADGGFSWFEGMNSSPVITAVILERMKKMLDAGFADNAMAVAGDAASCATLSEVLASAVKYLDDRQFAYHEGIPFWCGGISDWQYMFVRSMYPEVLFVLKKSADATSRKAVSERFDKFRKDAKLYLVPKHERGLNGYIIEKARRITILRNLLASDEGVKLAKTWGIKFKADAKMRASVEADIVSLLEYAVDHKDGGVYYPNAAMPFRGLLESEAYAHSMLCDLLSAYAFDNSTAELKGQNLKNVTEATRVADGIRIWLMLQKETQKWDETPAFVDAVNSVMSGSPAVKNTSVIALTATYTKPFEEIKAAGNGFTVERKFFREVSNGLASSGMASKDDKNAGEISLEEIRPGTVLNVGDKIIAQYLIHNDENRSFVKIVAAREAALRPVDQLSGYYGCWPNPLRVSSWYTFMPQGYRNVRAAATEYWFDSYPEEDTVISESFFVTQSGTFTAPAVTVESTYAPHYRANAGFVGKIKTE